VAKGLQWNKYELSIIKPVAQANLSLIANKRANFWKETLIT